MNKKLSSYLFLGTIVILGLLLVIFFGAGNVQKPIPPAAEQLAQCLTDRGVKIYGADWCAACRKQKELFGSAFKKINYVQCDKTPRFCTSEKIERFPTWVFGDGSRIEGVLPLEKLAEMSNCQY